MLFKLWRRFFEPATPPLLAQATINANTAIPTKAEIRNTTGFRIKSGRSTFDTFIRGSK
jgi:hypothetical protein